MLSRLTDFISKLKLRNMIMLTVAGIINSVGVTCFIAPVDLYDSGISGTSIFFSQITPISLSLWLLIFNVPLFLYGLKKQGGVFTFYAVYTVAVYSLGAWIIESVLPVDVSFSSPIAGTDVLLCAVFGGLISGIGSGTAVRYGGAMDGVEVMAVIFAKKIGMTVGTFVMAYNVVLYVIAGFVMSSWELPLYSIVTYYVGLKAVDFIVDGLDRAKCAMIITVEPDDVCKALGEAFETGSTKIDVIGGYSNMKKTMVYFIVNRFQIVKLKEIVHEIDPTAYITVSEVADVFKANQEQG